MRRPALALAALIAPGAARAQGGWDQVGEQEEPGFSWTQPLFDGFWMAWTPATLVFFVFIFGAIALMGLLEWRYPGGAARRGILGLETTRGDRLFITLLGSAFINIAWLGLTDLAQWWALVVCLFYAALVFRYV